MQTSSTTKELSPECKAARATIEAEIGPLTSTDGEPGECPANARLQRAFMLLQEKWVLFLVHHLLTKGPSGFNEVGRGGGVNTTTLSQRFALLEREGIVTRTVVSTFPPRTTSLKPEGPLVRR
ncbi:transcriptional regulator [bacterium]|nr:MAG: transcriptional regulator [bacterium]